MSDVFSIVVRVPTTRDREGKLHVEYPSVNHLGRDGRSGGRKTPAYRSLFADVVAVADSERRRIDWKMATGPCWFFVVRYVPDDRRLDASNLGKCEADALTKAGIWSDDSLAIPFPRRVTDPAGPDRVALVVIRGDERELISAPPPRKPRAEARKAPPLSVGGMRLCPSGHGELFLALVNGDRRKQLFICPTCSYEEDPCPPVSDLASRRARSAAARSSSSSVSAAAPPSSASTAATDADSTSISPGDRRPTPPTAQ